MFNRSLINLLGMCTLFLALLAIDAVIGTPIFCLGFLLSLVFFTPINRVFLAMLIFGFFYDVRFQLPFGSTFTLVAPFLFVYPFLVKFIHYRMILLFGYLSIVGSVLVVWQHQQFTRPAHVWFTLIYALVWTLCIYLYAIRRYQDFSFSTKKKSLKF